MWVRLVENLGRRTGLYKFLHDLAAQKARVLDLAVELAIGERARAALAELHVALGVERLLAPQTPGVLGALAHGFATFQHDGLEPHLRQHQCGKHAAGAKAHHDRALGQVRRCMPDRVVAHIGRGGDVGFSGKFRQQGSFA